MAVEQLITQHIDTWTSALQTRSTAGRGSNGKIDLYGIKKLRELILELAVRGKLVPQDPNDEPASELLKRIAAEKAELVKQGKIKKQKSLPEISEDDKPFELPEGWQWVRLGDVLSRLSNGYSGSQSKCRSQYPLTRIETISQAYVDYNKVGYCDDISPEEVEKFQLEPGDILLSHINSDFHLGKTALYYGGEKLIHGTNLLLLRAENEIAPQYLNVFITRNRYKGYFLEIAQHAIGQASVNQSKISSLVVALPPKKESMIIVAKVNELMSLCDQLEQQSLTSLDAHSQLVETLLATLTDSQNAEQLAENWGRISQHFDTLFTTEASIDALKQTILQLAVMGKLVPQDPNDEPASELLKRIEQEKAQLVKEGKIKKQKPLPPISDDEKPFELPKGWEWCRIAELGICSTGKTPSTSNSSYYSGKIPFLGPGDITPDGCISIGEKFVSVDGAEKSTIAYKNDILTVCIGGSIGKCGIVKELVVFNQQINCISPIIVRPDYIFYSFNTGAFLEKLISEATGSATPIINRGRWEMLLISLPPEKEMVRIINKAKQLLFTCDLIKSRLQLAQQTQLHLADALTDAALS